MVDVVAVEPERDSARGGDLGRLRQPELEGAEADEDEVRKPVALLEAESSDIERDGTVDVRRVQDRERIVQRELRRRG